MTHHRTYTTAPKRADVTLAEGSAWTADLPDAPGDVPYAQIKQQAEAAMAGPLPPVEPEPEPAPPALSLVRAWWEAGQRG